MNSTTSTQDPRRGRRLALRQVVAHAPWERGPLRDGWTLKLPAGGEWQGACLVGCDSASAPLPGSAGAPGCALALRTPVGTVRLGDAALLELGGGVLVDPSWPAEVLADVGRWATAQFDAGLASVFGGGVEWLGAAAVAAAAGGDATRPDVDLLLTLVSADDGRAHSFSIRVSAADLSRWLARVPWRALPPRRPCEVPSSLPFEGEAAIGATQLSIAALRGLRAGDAVQIESRCARGDGAGRLAVAGLELDFDWPQPGVLRCRPIGEGLQA